METTRHTSLGYTDFDSHFDSVFRYEYDRSAFLPHSKPNTKAIQHAPTHALSWTLCRGGRVLVRVRGQLQCTVPRTAVVQLAATQDGLRVRKVCGALSYSSVNGLPESRGAAIIASAVGLVGIARKVAVAILCTPPKNARIPVRQEYDLCCDDAVKIIANVAVVEYDISRFSLR